MSAAPTDCRVPDPSDKLDAKADGQFQAVNRRAGYGDDRLDRIIATARKGWTLAAGEGLVLVQEIDRLRDNLKYAQALLNQLHDSERLQDENAKLKAILAALREPSEAVMVGAFSAGAVWDVVTHTRKTIQLAVAAAEKEVQGE